MPQRTEFSTGAVAPPFVKQLITLGSDTHRDNYSMGCRAWALGPTTAEASMAAGAGCRRKVCGAAPQVGRLLKPH